MVWFDWRFCTAFWSCVVVLTQMTFAEAGGGAPRLGAAEGLAGTSRDSSDSRRSRTHIGTAFEKLGADVQARYRRMEGYAVFFLMGNDENTVKVAKRAADLGQDVKAYCDDMARQFREVWDALEISYDAFVQTSEG